MDILFKSICNRLADQVPELRWIDWEQGQLELPAENLPLQWPAVLVDIQDIQWSNVGNNMQTGDVQIQLRIIFDIFEDLYTVDGEPNPTRDIACDRLKLVNNVYAALQGFSGMIIAVPDSDPVTYQDNHFNKLNRIRSFTEKRNDGFKVIVMNFTTNMRDQNAMPVEAETLIQINVTGEYQHNE